MNMSPLTFCINTHNELQYLIYCVDSVRKNSFYKNAPFIIQAEKCTDGTNEWLNENKEKYNIDDYINDGLDSTQDGYVMDLFSEVVTTENIMFLQSYHLVSENWDLNCLTILETVDINMRTWISPHVLKLNEIQSNVDVSYIYNKKEMFDGYVNNFTDLNNSYELHTSDIYTGLIRKKDWDFIGGYDSLFKSTKYKNNDLCLRMLQQGYNFLTTGKSVIFDICKTKSYNFMEEDNYKWIRKWGVSAEYNDNNHIINNITNIFLNIPIVITNRDRFFPLVRQIKKLKHIGYNNIIIIDNLSTYPPLVEWYKENKYNLDIFYNDLVPNSHLSFRYLIESKHPKFVTIFNDWYIGTDSDVVLEEHTPHNFIDIMYNIATKYGVSKIGPGIMLENFNLSHSVSKEMFEYENLYWENSFFDSHNNINLYPHPIDTTFALHSPSTYPDHSHECIPKGASFIQRHGALRLGYPIRIEHIPFSYNMNKMPDDEKYYISLKSKDSGNFSGKI